MKPLIDISVPVSPNLPVYPGDPPVAHRALLPPSKDNELTLSQWTMTPHAGTHVDFPRHFFPEGRCSDDFDADYFQFDALVVDALELQGTGRHIDAGFLDSLRDKPDGVEAVLFRTHRGELWTSRAYNQAYTAIGGGGAEWLARNPRLKLVGVDYLSVDPHDADPMAAHLCFLGKGILILEGANLGAVDAGRYRLHCPPIRLARSEAAPCRAFLLPI